MAFKSGFVAIVGQANVGKSTLINHLIGKKVSIVSPKPQTTRDQILGVDNGEDYQIIFIDTPGIHKTKNKLDKHMQETIDEAAADVDVLLYIIDGHKEISHEDLKRLGQYTDKGYPVFVVINKADLENYQTIYPKLDRIKDLAGVDEFFVVSAKTGKNLDELKKAIISKLSDTVVYFPRDAYSAQSLGFDLAELIREKILWLLDDEIPHGVGVEITDLVKGETTHVSATIYCEKENHKAIIIGAKGAMLSKIGTECRLAMEKMLGTKVFLELFVKVKLNWRDKVKFE
ncbi:MAG: GTPase Era [Clostridia bacterium]|nr:GTPase Era [Clostridia bacterium]